MTQVINLSVDQSQLHSPGSFLGQSTGFLEVSTTYRSFIGTRAGSTSVTGKRILSQSALYRPENDDSSKYPVPVQVFKKPKKPRKTLDLQNEDNSNLSQKYLSRSKTERKSLGKIQPKPPIHPSKAKLAKETTKMSKTLILNKHLVQSKSQKKMTENKKSPSKSFSIPEIKIKEIEIKPEMTKTSEEKELRSVIRIDDIVKNTLIQEKVKKVKKIKAEQKQKAECELRKVEQKIQNNQIRQENSVKFRQEKFHPKIAWGANEKKILGLDTIKLQKEIEEERRHQREIRARTKSAEKDRLGLETLAELRIELGTISRSKSVSQEIVKPLKVSKKSNPKLKAFIKVKKQSRKESKEQEMLNHQAEEAKRLTQLKQLDIFAKTQVNLKKKKKRKLSKKKNNKKKPTKTWIEDSPISGSEEQSYQPLSSRRVNNERSDSKESLQEHFITNKNKEESKTQDILKKHIKYTNLEQNNQSGNIDFQDSSIINDQNLLENSSSNGKIIINESNTSIEFRKIDIKKRLDDLRYRIGKVKENLREASPDTKNQAAIKIQANIRRFLTQKRLARENFADEDEEVQKILSKEGKFKKNLEIQIEESPYSPSETSSEIPPENLMNILSPKTSTTNLEDRLIEELKNIEEIKQQKNEFKDILKDQLIWQENQKQNLQKLKEKELRELKEVTKKLGQGKELEKMLAEIIENRYLHLTNLIVENIANVQEALTKEQNLKQNEENMREYTGDSSSESSYFESQGSDKFMELFSGKIQKNIESDSDSLKPDELEKIMRELNKNRKFEESEDLSKLKAVSEIENATENDEDFKQFSEAPSYLSNISVENPQKIKSPTFGQGVTEPDECDEIIQKIMSNESYKISENESLKFEENKESFQEQKNSFDSINELEEVKEASQEQKTSIIYESSTSSIKKNESLVDTESKSEEIIKEIENEIENSSDSENQEIQSPTLEPPNPPMGSPQISEGPSITSFDLPNTIITLQQAEIFIEEFKSPETSTFIPHHDDSLDDLKILTPEPSSHTPESPLERPSAPFLSSDSEDDKSKPLTPLPELKLESTKIHLPPDLYRDITPELISMLSESILEMLINEDILPKPSFPILEMEEIAEPSLFTEPAIQTDHFYVQKYADEIFDLALQNIDDFIINLTKPLKRNALEVLARMQVAKIGTPIESEFVMPPAVLNVNYYLNLEHPRDANYSQRCLSPNTIQMISEAEHIHNKMIFDATNEALQKYRPYGLKGIPLPWSSSNRQLVDLHKNLSTMIFEIKKLLEKWSLVQAGKIPTQDLALTGGNFDEEYIQQMREERLASMLADDIIEKDNIWVEYEFEEAQVKLDIADMVLEDLVLETVNILDQHN